LAAERGARRDGGVWNRVGRRDEGAGVRRGLVEGGRENEAEMHAFLDAVSHQHIWFALL
jgi:hypothetical protein